MVVIFTTARSVSLSTPITLPGRPWETFRVGRKLHIDAIRFFHHVVIGNDVAAGIHDEAGAEGLADLVTLVAAAWPLTAKEAVEEVLKVLLEDPAGCPGPHHHSGRRPRRPGERPAPHEDCDGGNGCLPEAGSRC